MKNILTIFFIIFNFKCFGYEIIDSVIVCTIDYIPAPKMSELPKKSICGEVVEIRTDINYLYEKRFFIFIYDGTKYYQIATKDIGVKTRYTPGESISVIDEYYIDTYTLEDVRDFNPIEVGTKMCIDLYAWNDIDRRLMWGINKLRIDRGDELIISKKYKTTDYYFSPNIKGLYYKDN